MAFSGAVKLGDLNDFIAPSQACVVNLAPNAKLDAMDLQVDTVQLPPTRRDPKGFQQTQLAGDAVKVSLQDCLACSGCVTSAETVLLEHQSTGELMAALQSDKSVIVSVSPQSRASLGVLHKQSPVETAGKLAHFLKSLGAKLVLDTASSRDIALLETAQEFLARYTAKHPEVASSQSLAPSEAAECMDVDLEDRRQSHAQAGTNDSTVSIQPFLSSISNSSHNTASPAQPETSAYSHGINYNSSLNHVRQSHSHFAENGVTSEVQQKADSTEEKTHGSYILPFISTTKSPQAVMGTLVKRFLAKQLGLQPDQIYHCAVMPCYDKKLEGSRDDFNIPGTSIPEVDSVLTTSEVQQLVEQQAVSFPDLPCSPVDSVLGPTAPAEQLHGVHGGSGGYLEFVFRTAARQLFSRELPAGPVQMKTLRNADFREVSLEVDGQTVLRFAAAYGFRNIQTLVRKIKRRACEYDYVEVMACPSGCVNGGGQIKAHNGQSMQQLLDKLDQSYHAPEVVEMHPQDNPLVAAVYQRLGSGLYGAAAKDFLHTSYHHREKTVSAMIGDW
ncbi:hypothetical protein ABBQ32_004170 [Trebouxia sp. C0010 RCD-2024]